MFYTYSINNWAEDEAITSADYALDLFKSEGRDEYHAWLIEERRCIRNLFDHDQVLIDRFIEKFNALTARTTNLYI